MIYRAVPIGVDIPSRVNGVRVPQIASTYLGVVLDPRFRNKYIDRAVAILEASGIDFDAIAYTGVSGGLCAPIVAYKMCKSIIVVRKPDDTSTHSLDKVEGDRTAEKYIIVDDFIATGLTAGRIIQAMTKWSFATCVGAMAVVRPDADQEWFEYLLHPDTDRKDKGAIQNVAFRRAGEI